MKCPECNGKFNVIDSVVNTSKGAESSSKDRVNMVRKAKAVYDWTPDFVVRRRKCKDCGYKALTVELLLSDMEEWYEDDE